MKTLSVIKYHNRMELEMVLSPNEQWEKLYTHQHKIGDRVKREIDIHNPSRWYRIGRIISRYSKPKRKYGETILGPYPELYAVRWDNGLIEKGFFPHGLKPI